jgi:hypothetical protein
MSESKPNPGAALRCLFDAAKALDPDLTDDRIAEQIGVWPPALIDWTKGRSVPRTAKRAAIRKWISGLVDAVTSSLERAEVAGADEKVRPFSPRNDAA